MDYEIIATLGPASQEESTWSAMLAAGATAFRLNTSHLTLSQLHQWLERIDLFMVTSGSHFPVVLDLQGSKWRLGEFSAFELFQGQSITLVFAQSSLQQGTLPVPHADFFEAAIVSNGNITLNDAKIHLTIEKINKDTITARVTRAGIISPHKGITFTESKYRVESISDKDQAIPKQTQHLKYIRYAISYIKNAQEMAIYRSLLRHDAYLIAKLERKPAVEDAFRISKSADELWLCRGDLGAELGLKALGESVLQFSRMASSYPVPVIMAGQVLEHMTAHPTPTRSEICYLHDTLAQGYRGVVLSDETAIGKYPVESCKIAALYKNEFNISE